MNCRRFVSPASAMPLVMMSTSSRIRGLNVASGSTVMTMSLVPRASVLPARDGRYPRDSADAWTRAIVSSAKRWPRPLRTWLTVERDKPACRATSVLVAMSTPST